jgi:SAM-dependent methyltransferase
MSFTLKDIVPWGRSFDEYVAMFALSSADLQRKILGCGDGPASFNALLSRQCGRKQVLSVDPLYWFTPEDIGKRISETYEDVLEQTRKNKHEFIWTTIKSVDELGRIRMAAMMEFLSDYPMGLQQGRYVGGELPNLPIADNEFDLAVCSHLLFLYSEQLSEEFHVASIRELCRVAREVRVFPLLELGAKISRHLQAVTDSLSSMGYSVAIIPVSYEFQRGGNQMMKITAVEPGGALGSQCRAILDSQAE